MSRLLLKLSHSIYALALVLFALASFQDAWADQIRIVDSGGLVRAIKVTRVMARVVITFQGANASSIKGECIATNVDGLAAEKRVPVSAKAECAFSDVGGGSWQLTVPNGANWQVRIYE
jgi:hypothetical protein